MTKIYTLPAVTADCRDTSIGVEIADDEKLRSWLCDVKNHIVVDNFKFHWTRYPHDPTFFPCLGAFCVAHRMDGIYVHLQLCHEEYCDVLYPLGDLWSMLYKSERPSFGLCVTVTVQ